MVKNYKHEVEVDVYVSSEVSLCMFVEILDMEKTAKTRRREADKVTVGVILNV